MRILHTMLRVVNLERSITFYTEVLGMTMIRRQDYPDGRFTLVFLSYGPEAEQAALELTHNWDVDGCYDVGNGYGHIAIAVDDVYQACEKITELGGEVTRAAGPMKGGDTILAFVKDPDGYAIELLMDK